MTKTEYFKTLEENKDKVIMQQTEFDSFMKVIPDLLNPYYDYVPPEGIFRRQCKKLAKALLEGQLTTIALKEMIAIYKDEDVNRNNSHLIVWDEPSDK